MHRQILCHVVQSWYLQWRTMSFTRAYMDSLSVYFFSSRFGGSVINWRALRCIHHDSIHCISIRRCFLADILMHTSIGFIPSKVGFKSTLRSLHLLYCHFEDDIYDSNDSIVFFIGRWSTILSFFVSDLSLWCRKSRVYAAQVWSYSIGDISRILDCVR